MESGSFDEASGWAEFASFENEKSGFPHDFSLQQNQTNIFNHSNFARTEAKDNRQEVKTADHFESEHSISLLLQWSFENPESDEKLSNNFVGEDSDVEYCGESKSLGVEVSSLWQSINESADDVCQIIWIESKFHQNFMKTIGELLKEADQSVKLLPDVLDLTHFIRCLNFHKFAKRKNIPTNNNRTKDLLPSNQNPASELNPFAPDNFKELDRYPSDNSIHHSDSLNSLEYLSIKEAECSSTTSAESEFEGNEETSQAGVSSAGKENPILERWKLLQGADNLIEAAQVEFSVSELQTLKHEFQQSSNALSETLVRQLREKDELLREKQVRDDFISSLLAVSRKQKQQEVSQTSKRKKILSHVFGHVEPTENKFLDTSIPYFPTENGPSLADIIALTSIFEAILEDNPKVPGMVSNYIMSALKQMQLNGGIR